LDADLQDQRRWFRDLCGPEMAWGWGDWRTKASPGASASRGHRGILLVKRHCLALHPGPGQLDRMLDKMLADVEPVPQLGQEVLGARDGRALADRSPGRLRAATGAESGPSRHREGSHRLCSCGSSRWSGRSVGCGDSLISCATRSVAFSGFARWRGQRYGARGRGNRPGLVARTGGPIIDRSTVVHRRRVSRRHERQGHQGQGGKGPLTQLTAVRKTTKGRPRGRPFVRLSICSTAMTQRHFA